MRVLILGGGTVGASIAEFLCGRNHQVTVVDSDPAVIRSLDSELDIGTVTGSAARQSVLFQAGATTADLCLALTGNDETNIVAASMAKAMGATRTAARVFADISQELNDFDYGEYFHIDRLLSIEYLTAMELARRIREPGILTIEYFARGELEMQEVVITRESSANGVPLSELKLPPDVRIGSIVHDGQAVIAGAADVIVPSDRITILGKRNQVESVKKRFNVNSSVKKLVTIAGGGETGTHLARLLKNRNCTVRLLDVNQKRCYELADQFDGDVDVLYGDARRKITLEEERVGASDFFIAATGDDENNILACIEAKELGADNVMAVIDRPDYADVVERLGIDQTVSPRVVMERQVEGLLHTGALLFDNPYLLGRGISVVELEAEENSPITQNPLKECRLPKHSLLVSVVRNRFVQIPYADFQLKAKDSVVALVHAEEIPELAEAFTAPASK